MFTADVYALVSYSRAGVQTISKDGRRELNVASLGMARPPLGSLMAPLETLIPTSQFGLRVNPLSGSAGEFHWGQDFGSPWLRQAIAVARAAPPLLVAGDLNEELLALAGQAPSDAALVVFHSAVMAYLDAPDRDRFRSTMARLARDRGCHWLSNEGHSVIMQPDGSSVVPEMDDARLRGRFLLVHNGNPVAIAGPHGQSLEWLDDSTS